MFSIWYTRSNQCLASIFKKSMSNKVWTCSELTTLYNKHPAPGVQDEQVAYLWQRCADNELLQKPRAASQSWWMLRAISSSWKKNPKHFMWKTVRNVCLFLRSLPIWNKQHSNNSKDDIKLYISDKGMNKSLRHQRLLYTKYKQC